MAINFPDSPTNGQEFTSGTRIFVYDAARDSWAKKTESQVLAGLVDVDAAGATVDQHLSYTGTKWINTDISSGLTTYATVAALPISGNENGDLTFVTANNRIYIWNGGGWYSIALLNLSPTAITGNSASYSLAMDGTPLVLTLVSEDPEGFALTWSHSITSGTLGSTATIEQADNVFTITPSTDPSNAGDFGVTFSVTEGTNIITSISSFLLTFVNVTVTNGTESNAAGKNVITWQQNGTLTIDGNLTVDILAVAGGGGGASSSGSGGGRGGGGAGGMLVSTSQTLAAGTYNIEVGAGGAGGASGTDVVGNQGNISKLASNDGDEHWDNVGLLVTGSGGLVNLKDDSTITNVSATTVTGNHHDDAWDFVGGYLYGTGSELTNMGVGDIWTIEAWINPDEWGWVQRMFSSDNFHFGHGSAYGNVFHMVKTGGGYAEWNFGGTMTMGAWNHVAFVKEDDLYCRVWVNGTQVGSAHDASSTNFNFATSRFGSRTISGGEYWNGQMEEWRITLNVARYQAGNTYTSAPFQVGGSTVSYAAVGGGYGAGGNDAQGGAGGSGGGDGQNASSSVGGLGVAGQGYDGGGSTSGGAGGGGGAGGVGTTSNSGSQADGVLQLGGDGAQNDFQTGSNQWYAGGGGGGTYGNAIGGAGGSGIGGTGGGGTYGDATDGTDNTGSGGGGGGYGAAGGDGGSGIVIVRY